MLTRRSAGSTSPFAFTCLFALLLLLLLLLGLLGLLLLPLARLRDVLVLSGEGRLFTLATCTLRNN